MSRTHMHIHLNDSKNTKALSIPGSCLLRTCTIKKKKLDQSVYKVKYDRNKHVSGCHGDLRANRLNSLIQFRFHQVENNNCYLLVISQLISLTLIILILNANPHRLTRFMSEPNTPCIL